jgi:hypothetical protein
MTQPGLVESYCVLSSIVCVRLFLAKFGQGLHVDSVFLYVPTCTGHAGT